MRGTGDTKLLGDPILYDLQHNYALQASCTPNLYELGDKNFFAHQFTDLYPHYGIRAAAPVLRWLAHEELIWLFNYELFYTST